MNAYALIVAASLLDYTSDDVDSAKAMVQIFKTRHPDMWEACLRSMDPRHVGGIILDVVLRQF